MQINWLNKAKAETELGTNILKDVLFYDGSLTRYLQSRCKSDISLEIISESWNAPFQSECGILNIDKNQVSLVRLSWLKSDTEKLIFARTIIPKPTHDLIAEQLSALGDRPLGELLFSETSGYRATMQYAKISSACEWLNQVTELQQVMTEFWTRQSIFFIKDRPLLILELFLPQIEHCIKS